MLIVNVKQVKEKVRVTTDNVRFFDAIMRADNGHGMAYLQTLDQRPYIDMLLEAGVFFTAPHVDYRPDVAQTYLTPADAGHPDNVIL